jgi:small-conductance mechanosensitive channel
MQDLLQQALLLSIVFGFIFGGAVVWRRLALRYVLDPRRFHQLMVFRTMTVVLVSVMVLIFKFATDLAALATVMGFAAAGIAFALQNVILSVVGYFSIIGRNGIRVGDRVGLQGPFGYVYGEILELGILRISLRELTSGPDNWTPSGRTVVFPNSVVFTGSFLKLPRSAPSTHKTT